MACAIHTETVYGPSDRSSQILGFSPLDHWAGGHQPFSVGYAFGRPIDVDRFRAALQLSLGTSPEMGVGIATTKNEHVMHTGQGIRLIVQDSNGACASEDAATILFTAGAADRVLEDVVH